MNSLRSRFWNVGRAAAVTVAIAGAGLSLPAASASAATHTSNTTATHTSNTKNINRVSCGRVFLRINFHPEGNLPAKKHICLANAGTWHAPSLRKCNGECWLDSFRTGNNRVQFKSDGRWQPAKPVGKFTRFTFPSHPGGVSFTAIRIR